MLERISIVMPVYNEAEIIEETITIFIGILAGMAVDFEIIVVNDGSNDGTGDILAKISALRNNVKVVNNEKNLGSGASLWAGLKAASGDLVMSNFADRPFDMRDLEYILPVFGTENVDFIIVARKDRSANTLYRKATSYFNYLLIKLLFNYKIKDYQFVQIYRKEILKHIDIKSAGTFMAPELIIKLISAGYSYKQVQCDFHKRPGGLSKCGKPQVIIKTIIEMLNFRFSHRFNRQNI